MIDNAELHGKILSFLMGEFARKEGRQCVSVEICYAPGGGFKEEPIRKWVRADEPDLFDNFANIEKLVSQIVEIATGEADAKPPGKHRFVRANASALGRSRDALVLRSRRATTVATTQRSCRLGVAVAASDQGVIANHASQLMRINAQMFEGTIRVLGQQNMGLHEQVQTLTRRRTRRCAASWRRRGRTRWIASFRSRWRPRRMRAPTRAFRSCSRSARVVAAKIGGGDEGQGRGASSLAMLIVDFGNSLRPDQTEARSMSMLDMAQKIMFMEIMKMAAPSDGKPPDGSPGPSLPINGTNGAPTVP